MLEAVSSLPDDVESLRQIIAGLTGELAAAKAGLVTKSLEIETLKVQIARLRGIRAPWCGCGWMEWLPWRPD